MKYRARHRGPVIDRVRAAALIERGLSNLQVADALGCAPNTVPGIKRDLGFAVETRAHRGVPRLPAGELEARKRARDRERSKRRYVRRRESRADTDPNGQCQLALVVPPVAVVSEPRPVDSGTIAEHPGTRGVPFADLSPRGCQFAVTPHHVAVSAHLFCNAPRADHRYCAEHLERCTDRRGTEKSRAGSLGNLAPWSQPARARFA